jgi:hypothetical protein
MIIRWRNVAVSATAPELTEILEALATPVRLA